MGPTHDYEAALRSELLKAANRPRIHRQRHRIAMGAIGAVALIAGVVLASRVDAPRPLRTADTASTTNTTVGKGSVAVDRRDGRVVVTLGDRANSAQQVDTAMGETGLDIHVQAKPVGPSKEGLFVGYAERGGTVDEGFVQDDRTAFDSFSLPEDWQGQLVVYLGREATAVEDYLTVSDAYAEGEPLACSKTLGQPLSRLQPSVEGYTVRVITYADGQPSAQLTYAEALDQGLGDETVTKVSAPSPTELVVDVVGPTIADAPFKC